MVPVAEVTDAVVQLVRGRVGREEGCRSAHTALAVGVKTSPTCGEGERSRVFEGWRLSSAFVEAVPPLCGFMQSLDLSFPRRVFLCLQPDGR